MSEDKPIDKTSTQEVCEYLTQRSEHLPMGVETRLNRARMAAVNADTENHSAGSRLLWPAAGVVAAGLAAVMFWVARPVQLDQEAGAQWLVANDWDIVLSSQDFELLTNELDFYQWLAEQENSG